MLTPLRGPRGAHEDELVRLTVQVPEDSREQLEQLALERGVSLAQAARDVLALGLASLGGPASE